MHVSPQILDQIIDLAKKHQVIAIGEIHGIKENTEVFLEVFNALKSKYSLRVGFEYPQSLVDNPSSADEVLFQDGRFSLFHKELLESLKKDGIKVFGFDLNNDQVEEQKTQSIDWRDKIMAENINRQIEGLDSEEKILIITGDMHYQTKTQTITYPHKDGVMKSSEYLPMGAQIKANSVLAIHLRYLSGEFYNFKLKQISKINANKNNSFRDVDDLLEIDISEANTTK